MALCNRLSWKASSQGPEDHPVEISPTGYPRIDGVFLDLQVSGSAQRENPLLSSLFNPGDPDLSFCDVLAANGIETESDQPPTTVNVDSFTDLMLFPDLAELEAFEDFPEFQDLPVGPTGEVNGPLKARDGISSVTSAPPSVASDGGETSPAESDVSVDHFFNTFTDLTGFLVDLVEETGPSDLTDFAASIAESKDTLTTDAESSAMASTNLPTPVGSETACAKKKCIPRRPATPSDSDDEAPPTKKARISKRKGTNVPAEFKYRQRRDKNNIASQRSRATRKQRESEMAEQAVKLEAENARLRIRIDELTTIAEEARRSLVIAMSRK